MIRLLTYLYLVIGLLAPTLLCAQTTGFEHYGMEEGLASSDVNTLVQDNEGRLWIGTIAGLSCYEGEQLTTYTEQHGLAHNWVSASALDKSGNVWFGHINGSVSVFHANTEVLEPVNFGAYGEFHPISTVFEASDGLLWFGTNGGGLFAYNPVEQTMLDVPTEADVPGLDVLAISEDASGNLWVGTTTGIAVLSNSNAATDANAWTLLEAGAELQGVQITALEPARGNAMWIGTNVRGVYVVSVPGGVTPGGRTMAVATPFEQGTRLPQDHITVICSEQSGAVWIGTRSHGVFRFENTKGAGLKGYSSNHGLNFDDITAILEDREGNIWIGTRLGVNRYSTDKFLVYETTDGLSHNIVWSVMEDSKGRLWLGTNDGITEMTFEPDPETGRPFTTRIHTTADGLSSNVTLSLSEGPDGSIWAGTNGLGVNRLKPGATKWETFTEAEGLSGNIVFSIAHDAEGRTWFGTMGGATRYDPATNVFRRFDDRDGLGGKNVYTIYPDSKGNLWFGILGGYLSRYRNGEFSVYDESYGIKQRFIQSIAEDSKGDLWFGVNRGGIYRYNGTQFQYFSLESEGDPGQPYYIPYSVVADEEDNIWIGTSRGIARLNQASGTFAHYGEKEGFLGVETNSNAITRDQQGNLWFGTIMGAVRFNPGEDQPNTVPPVTRITGLKVFHESTTWPEAAQFAYNQNHLTLSYIGVSLTNPDKVGYQYKLEGFDAGWSPVTNHREAVYANLEAGSYVFKVRSSNEQGIWNPEPVSYAFEILAPIWQEPWFYFLCLAVVLLVLFLYVRARALRFKRLKTTLEEQVKASSETIALKDKDLADSAAYTRQIVAGIMTDAATATLPTAESFILYQPRQHLAGDFVKVYQQNGQTLAAMVDSDANEARGDLQAVLAFSALGTLIDQHGISEPALLLNKLCERLQGNAAGSMGIGLYLLANKPGSMVWASAGQDIWLVRNGKAAQHASPRAPLALKQQPDSVQHTSQNIDLQAGDLLYMLTDGYLKQINASNGQQFSAARFTDLLEEIAGNAFPEQEIIVRERHKGWQGEGEQTDDIVVIGIRI